jgi:putative effector of murein hydrolase LrgA (UPF0299 family)
MIGAAVVVALLLFVLSGWTFWRSRSDPDPARQAVLRRDALLLIPAGAGLIGAGLLAEAIFDSIAWYAVAAIIIGYLALAYVFVFHLWSTGRTPPRTP